MIYLHFFYDNYSEFKKKIQEYYLNTYTGKFILKLYRIITLFPQILFFINDKSIN